MDVERIIGKLLTQHNCVIIPGFGGFVANPKGATIHPGRHTFAPPYKAILFNRSLTANDGLLANALVHQNAISYAEATNSIAQFVRQTNHALQNRNKIVFAELGFLQADVEGNINFTQDHSVNYLYDSFGLDEFQSLPVATKSTTIRQRVQPKANRVVKHPARSVKRRPVKSIVAALGFVLIITLASTIVGIGINQANNMASMAGFFAAGSNNPTIKTKAVVAPKKQTTAPVATVNTPISQPAQVAKSQPAVQPANAPAKIIVPVIADADIHIIAASFNEADKANKYAATLKQQGFDTFVIDKMADDDTYKVGIASFYSLSSAKQYIGLLRAPLNEKAWIYTNK